MDVKGTILFFWPPTRNHVSFSKDLYDSTAFIVVVVDDSIQHREALFCQRSAHFGIERLGRQGGDRIFGLENHENTWTPSLLRRLKFVLHSDRFAMGLGSGIVLR